MKVEYCHDDGGNECSLIRIYGGSKDQFILLKEAIESLLQGRKTFKTEEIPGFQSVNETQLHCVRSDINKGVYRLKDQTFVCELTTDKWKQVTNLLEPFCVKDIQYQAYQWLDETSDIQLLVSIDGHW